MGDQAAGAPVRASSRRTRRASAASSTLGLSSSSERESWISSIARSRKPAPLGRPDRAQLVDALGVAHGPSAPTATARASPPRRAGGVEHEGPAVGDHAAALALLLVLGALLRGALAALALQGGGLGAAGRTQLARTRSCRRPPPCAPGSPRPARRGASVAGEGGQRRGRRRSGASRPRRAHVLAARPASRAPRNGTGRQRERMVSSRSAGWSVIRMMCERGGGSSSIFSRRGAPSLLAQPLGAVDDHHAPAPSRSAGWRSGASAASRSASRICCPAASTSVRSRAVGGALVRAAGSISAQADLEGGGALAGAGGAVEAGAAGAGARRRARRAGCARRAAVRGSSITGAPRRSPSRAACTSSSGPRRGSARTRSGKRAASSR